MGFKRFFSFHKLSTFFLIKKLDCYNKLNIAYRTIRLAVLRCFFAIGLTHLTTYDRILLSMRFNLFGNRSKKAVKTISDYKQEILVKQGREQFKKLLEKGINIPVVLL